MLHRAPGDFRNGPARYRLVIYVARHEHYARTHAHAHTHTRAPTVNVRLAACDHSANVHIQHTCTACVRARIQHAAHKRTRSAEYHTNIYIRTLSNTPRRVVKISNDIEYIIYVVQLRKRYERMGARARAKPLQQRNGGGVAHVRWNHHALDGVATSPRWFASCVSATFSTARAKSARCSFCSSAKNIWYMKRISQRRGRCEAE